MQRLHNVVLTLKYIENLLCNMPVFFLTPLRLSFLVCAETCLMFCVCVHVHTHMVKYAMNFRNKHEQQTNLRIGIRQQVFAHHLLYHFITNQTPIVFLLYCVLKCLLGSLNSCIILSMPHNT